MYVCVCVCRNLTKDKKMLIKKKADIQTSMKVCGWRVHFVYVLCNSNTLLLCNSHSNTHTHYLSYTHTLSYTHSL
jgi:hypothetical protein